MARRKDPKLRHHKATGQAVVAIQGTQICLGKFGTREAEQRYRLVLSGPQAARAKWLKTHQKVDVDNPTIAHLLSRYRHHLRAYFGPDSQTPADTELAPRGLSHALSTVSGLRAGRGGARRPKPVKPVPERVVWAVLSYLTPVVRDMVSCSGRRGCGVASCVG
jgi:hypothetical protein